MGSPLYEEYYNEANKLSDYLNSLNKLPISLSEKFNKVCEYLEDLTIKDEVQSIITDYESEKISIQLRDRII